MALTAQQEAFVNAYVATGDGPAAYRAAYDVGADTLLHTIQTEISRMFAHPEITRRLGEVRNLAVTTGPTAVTLQEVVAFFYDVATADPRELVELKVGNCRHCHGEGHAYRWRDSEYADALAIATKGKAPLPEIMGGLGWRPFHAPHPDCPECGGAGVSHPVFKDTANLSPKARKLYAGVKATRQGMEVLMHDQMKAWDNLCRILGGYADGLNLKLTPDVPALMKAIKDMDPHTAATTYLDMVKTTH